MISPAALQDNDAGIAADGLNPGAFPPPKKQGT